MKNKMKYLFAILIISLLCGCARKTTQTVIERHDSMIYVQRIDTVKEKNIDSVIVQVIGDTVYKEAWRTRYVDRVSIKTDTVTINSVEPEIVNVDKPVTPKWCWYLLLGVIGYIIIKIIIAYVKKSDPMKMLRSFGRN